MTKHFCDRCGLESPADQLTPVGEWPGIARSPRVEPYGEFCPGCLEEIRKFAKRATREIVHA